MSGQENIRDQKHYCKNPIKCITKKQKLINSEYRIIKTVKVELTNVAKLLNFKILSF